MLATKRTVAAAALAALAVAAPAAQANPIAAPATSDASCVAAPRPASMSGATGYRAPTSGFLNVRLDGDGDWDLVLRDAAGRRLGASQGFSGRELVQSWVAAGQRVTAVACRRPGASGTPRVAFRLVDAKHPVQKGATRVARVQITSQRQVARLEALGFDMSHSQTQSAADVLVNGDAQLARLKQTGMNYRIVTRDLFKRDLKTLRTDARRALARRTATSARAAQAAGALPSGRTTYRTYEEYGTELKKLVDDNPGLVRPLSFGTSYQGRELSGIEIANDVNGNDGRPVYFVMGVHHAREWPAGEAAMELAYLLTESRSDPRIARLLATERVVILPLVNPDGFIVSRNAFSISDNVAANGDPGGGADTGALVEAIAPPGGFGAYRRKNCNGENGLPALPCESAYGVDNNRNYGNLWGGPGGSPDPTAQSYHGRTPRSEPETRAVFDYVRTHHVTNLITIHTVAGLVLRPPGLASSGFAPDEARMKEIGDAMASAAGYVSQYSFQLYDTAGTTEDDTYAATGGYGYTYEMGTLNGPFHGAYADSVVNEWTGDNDHAKNRGGVREALLLGAEAANSDPDHAIFTGTAPAGRILHLTKRFNTLTSPFCQLGADPPVNPTDPACAGTVQNPISLDDSLDSKTIVPASGRFEWHVGQSTRPFVGGGAVFETVTEDPAAVATIQGSTLGAPGSSHEERFTLPAAADRLTIRLAANVAAEDYDIVVFHGGQQVGSSGNAPGTDELVELPNAPAGEYTVRVDYYAAVTGTYTITATKSTVSRTVTSGTKESYTLACEDTAGNVLSTDTLTIDRGATIAANLPCEAGGGSTIGAPTTSTTGTGTPIAPASPAPTGGANKVSKSLRLRVTGVNLKASHKGRVRVRVHCPKGLTAACKGTMRLRAVLAANKRVTVVATRRFTVRSGRSSILALNLTRSAFKALNRRGRIAVTVSASGAAGKRKLTASRRLALRRP